MSYVKLDDTNTAITVENIMQYKEEVKQIHKDLHEKIGRAHV